MAVNSFILMHGFILSFCIWFMNSDSNKMIAVVLLRYLFHHYLQVVSELICKCSKCFYHTVFMATCEYIYVCVHMFMLALSPHINYICIKCQGCEG